VKKPSDSMAPAPGFKAIKFSRDWITRPVFAVLLAGACVAAIFGGSPWLEIAAAVAVFLGAREWHRMVGEGRFAIELVAATAVLCAALSSFILWPHTFIPGLILAAGTSLLFTIGLLQRNHPVWHAVGVVYLGLPALSVIALRDYAPHGAWVLIGLFLTVWATDTGALFCGNLIGGPKIAPVLSPNKTWAGTIGGVVASTIIQAVFIAIMGGNALLGALFGAGMAVVAHSGDLFESWVKRCFHRKDSGSMIPGHGGVLDRIDSTLATLVVLAVLVLVLKLDPLFGALQ
jgi:phosphatidate cytidylyltransferase